MIDARVADARRGRADRAARLGAAGLWLSLGTSWIAAAVLLAAASPAAPRRSWQLATAVPAGVAAGVALYVVLGGLSRVAFRPPRSSTVAVLVVSAGAEEVVWRWFALGELSVRVGALPALVLSSLGFAVAHRRWALEHIGAGLAFGSLYLAGGSLAGVCSAHAVYNVCVAAARQGAAP